MATIAFVLLCHKDPDAVVRLADALTRAGDRVAIHFDASAPAGAFAAVEAGTRDNPGVVLARRRVRCGWGEWSLVRATLETLATAAAAFPDATHFYMISGDCRPIKSAEHAHGVLDARDVDYIESFDFFTSDWIKTGMKEDRLVYRHLFNERTHPRLFYGALALQRRLGLGRAIPAGLDVMIGSQWWCLRRSTIERLLAFCRERRDVLRFFSTTWIPDETFFQTLVRHLVPREEIDARTPTFLMFTDYGMPATFHDDHHDLLLSQDFLFARKISPEARELTARLEALWTSGRRDFPVAGDGRRLFAFLTGKGREGRRFAPRIWEEQSRIGRDRELIVLVCKKWHVAKRLAARLRAAGIVPAVDYLFNEEGTALPDLGGAETTMAKRHRHRRALLRLIFDRLGTDRLAICLDPAEFDLLRDLGSDPARMRVLLIDCRLDEAYLRGHAERIGLIGAATPEAAVAALLPTLARDIEAEIARLRDGDLPDILHLQEAAPEAKHAAVLAKTFDLDPDRGQTLAPGLFDD